MTDRVSGPAAANAVSVWMDGIGNKEIVPKPQSGRYFYFSQRSAAVYFINAKGDGKYKMTASRLV